MKIHIIIVCGFIYGVFRVWAYNAWLNIVIWELLTD